MKQNYLAAKLKKTYTCTSGNKTITKSSCYSLRTY